MCPRSRAGRRHWQENIERLTVQQISNGSPPMVPIDRLTLPNRVSAALTPQKISKKNIFPKKSFLPNVSKMFQKCFKNFQKKSKFSFFFKKKSKKFKKNSNKIQKQFKQIQKNSKKFKKNSKKSKKIQKKIKKIQKIKQKLKINTFFYVFVVVFWLELVLWILRSSCDSHAFRILMRLLATCSPAIK